MAVTHLEKRIDLLVAAEALPEEQKQWQVLLRRFARHRMAVASAILILFVITVSLFARSIAPFTAVELELGNTFAPPFTVSESGRMHWLGTDHLRWPHYFDRRDGVGFGFVAHRCLFRGHIGVFQGLGRRCRDANRRVPADDPDTANPVDPVLDSDPIA